MAIDPDLHPPPPAGPLARLDGAEGRPAAGLPETERDRGADRQGAGSEGGEHLATILTDETKSRKLDDATEVVAAGRERGRAMRRSGSVVDSMFVHHLRPLVRVTLAGLEPYAPRRTDTMGKVPSPSSPRLSLLHAYHPPGNLAAKVSVSNADGPESFGVVLRSATGEAAVRFDELVASGQLLDSGRPAAWTYRIVRDGEHSLGLVVAVDRTGGAPPSPLATLRGIEPDIGNVRASLSPALLELMRSSTTERPLFHFKASDGLTHTGWTIADAAAVATELAAIGAVEGPDASPDRFVGRVILADTPAFPPRLGLFVRRLESVTAARP